MMGPSSWMFQLFGSCTTALFSLCVDFPPFSPMQKDKAVFPMANYFSGLKREAKSKPLPFGIPPALAFEFGGGTVTLEISR